MLFETGGGRRGGLCLLKESSLLIAGLAAVGIWWRIRTRCAAASHCWAVPRALVQAVMLCFFLGGNILTSQFPEYFCRSFIPAFYLY